MLIGVITMFSGDRLKAVRKYKNLTMEDLIQKLENESNLKVNKGMVSRWENEKASPREETVKALASILDVDVNYLMGVMTLEYVIQEQRYLNKMTTEELSKKSGVAHNTIYLTELNIDTPNKEELQKIGEALGISDFRSYLLERDIIVFPEDINNLSSALNLARNSLIKIKNAESNLDLHVVLSSDKNVFYEEHLFTDTEKLKIKKMIEILINKEV
ncbi:helix-turn-helix domain-containing protein [Bacillus idriensis]|uniref:Helix-turn-helix domain-containing protein n=2 Tax=Metabacillus idriensis TaxID=324768 RepID=A0A6I2MHW0_9BACI|nr:helix-turn-helix domain-containing protein [Metabacillus idriensis]